jgi:hypothetical protein
VWGHLEVKGDGTISYTPNGDYNGKDTITVTVIDDDGLKTIKTSLITVNSVNDAPTLTVESTASVAEDGTTSISFEAGDDGSQYINGQCLIFITRRRINTGHRRIINFIDRD